MKTYKGRPMADMGKDMMEPEEPKSHECSEAKYKANYVKGAGSNSSYYTQKSKGAKPCDSMED